MLPLWARVDQGASTMKEYSAFPKAPASDCLVSYPGHSLARRGCLLQRCTWCILRPQLTWPSSSSSSSSISLCVSVKQHYLLVFPWNVSHSKSPQVTRFLLSVVTDLNASLWRSPFSLTFSIPTVSFLNFLELFQVVLIQMVIPSTYWSIVVFGVISFFLFISSLARSKF